MIYRKADGTPLTAEEIKARTVRANRLNGARKAQRTKGEARKFPTMHGGMTATEYVRMFERWNNLKPVEYAWAAHPRSHYGHVDHDPVEIREAA
jgi:hypothetical protein